MIAASVDQRNPAFMPAPDTNANPTIKFNVLRAALIDHPIQVAAYEHLLHQHYGAFPIERLYAIARWYEIVGGSPAMAERVVGAFRRIEATRALRKSRVADDTDVHTVKVRGRPIRFVTDDPATVRFIRENLIASWPYEAGVMRYLILRLRRNDVFVDVGAHAGYFSLIAHTLDAVAFAIEPQRDMIRVIERNVAANDADRIQPLNLAVSDHDGLVGFARIGGTAGVQMHGESLHATHPSPQSRHADWVPVVRLDSLFLEDLVLPRIVKIDVEGMELRALAGASGLIARNDTAFVVEFHPRLIGGFGGNLADLAGIFDPATWRTYDVTSDPPVPVTLADTIAENIAIGVERRRTFTLAFEPLHWGGL